MSFHTRIKNRRTALFSSHEAFAHELETTYGLKVSWQAIQQWEKENGTAPNRSRMPAVVKALKTTSEWLLYGTGPEVAGEEETSPPVVTLAPASGPPWWVNAEAYQLLEFYHLADADGRERITRFAKLQADANARSVVGNKG